MKKLVAILLIAICTLSFVSCEDDANLNLNNSYEKDGDYYYANEKPKEIYYNVKFETNGGSSIAAKEIKSGGQITTAPNTERDGYLFEGWFLDQTLTQGAVFPLTINNDTTIYAKWLKTWDTQSYRQTTLDAKIGRENYATWSISPEGFNMDRLQELGYRIKITIIYVVSYTKDYDALLDIGYFGAPEYETYILNDETIVNSTTKVKASTTKEQKEITYTARIADIKDKSIKFKVATDNIQNQVHFENIIVTYECIK